jgi:hypothetical protein
LQEARQSAESQHDALAAFTAPARPSAITAINTIARIFFIDFSPLKNQLSWFLSADGAAISEYRGKIPGKIPKCVAAVFRGACLCRFARRAEQIPMTEKPVPSSKQDRISERNGERQ